MISNCRTEYGPLKEVILCPPTYMRIKEVINSIQAHYKEANINIPTALKQHQKLIDTLRSLGVQVHELQADEQFPEQVFTRDIGFVIDQTLYLAALERPIRQGEEQVLKTFLDQKKLNYQLVTEGTIEGGDVIIDGDHVYIGVSSRTCTEVVERIKEQHPDKTVQPIHFNSSYLHLDCVFNPVSDSVALIYPEAIEPESVKILASHYSFIEVSKEEQFSLAVNVLSLGENKIIVLPENKDTNDKLKQKGFELYEIPFSEIIKSGGSFRCVTMPLTR
ncbi:dimethylarginine dimethylaminohydrolase family protein [Alkalihalobacillus sp. NPDC078783]